MKAYLLAAAGVIFLSVVVSLLIPEGKLHKSVTFIMRIICLVVLIQPVTGIFKIKDVSTEADGFFDYEYVCQTYSAHQSEQLENLLEKEFEIKTECTVNVNYADGQFKVSGVEVELEKNNAKLIEPIYAYLDGLHYINITVYAKST